MFTHGEKDLKSFRLFTSQLYLEGKVKQADLVKVFGVSAISVKRAVKLYEAAGPGGFWRAQPTRGPSVLTAEILKQAQEQLDQGRTLQEVAAQLEVKYDTMRKAVRAGRLHEAVKKRDRSRLRPGGLDLKHQERAQSGRCADPARRGHPRCGRTDPGVVGQGRPGGFPL